ncbi:MAG TPA: hypothetical protein VK753_11785 [Xanthomonadaceae bacterium]|jgi:hypothetical protein|nr:hypothetical protein [Xanthomonadaceae bacterium]
MFLFTFGGLWFELYALGTLGMTPVVPVAIAIATVALLVVAYRRYRQHKPALAAEVPTPGQTRADRVFHIVNAGQWVVIFIVASVLSHLGLSSWTIPAIIFIVGLHFLPLAHAFANPPHYATGASLIVLAVAYPLLAPHGPTDSIGCLGAGLILWASALWAVTGNRSSRRTRLPGVV